MLFKNTFYKITEIITNLMPGQEISITEQRTIEQAKDSPFIKLYIDALIKLYGLPKGELKISFKFIQRMNYQS